MQDQQHQLFIQSLQRLLMDPLEGNASEENPGEGMRSYFSEISDEALLNLAKLINGGS